MALDGIMLGMIAKEIEKNALSSKVDKVQQPSRDELILVMRGSAGQARLLISARAAYPRVNLTDRAIENPAQPPMLCMLLRKKLCGGRLVSVRQMGCDRVLMLDFDCINELYDHETLTLAIEIMGRCSNAVLISQNGMVLDALRRVDVTMSSKRMILPGCRYELPPSQDKLNPRECTTDEILNRILSLGDMPLEKAALSSIQGISPIISREIAYRCGASERLVCSLDQTQTEKLRYHLEKLASYARDEICEPTLVCDKSGRPIDLAFMNVGQYSTAAVTRSFESCSALLDGFCYERDLAERIKARSHDLLKTIASAADRAARKLDLRRSELKKAQGREEMRMYGDLINANIYRLEKGSPFCEVENYFSPGMETVRIPLDPRLTPAQNAQKYYKEYRRLQNAEKHLGELLSQGEQELEYLDSVLDMLALAKTAADVAEIKEELCEQGYIRRQGDSRKKQSALPPDKFVSSDGFEILVGRNNKQNDRLTLKEAAKTDIWLHACKMPGAHVIVRSKNGVKPSEQAVEQAAVLAALRSKGKDSDLVPVDMTEARYVSKPQGARPGMVIYTHQTTLYIHPDKELEEKLRARK